VFVLPEVVDIAFDSGRDAVRALVAAQAEEIAGLRVEIEELKRLMGRNSKNSSLPPSRDSREARNQRSKKRSSGKQQGGQPGHPGQHREMVADPDRVVEHRPLACSGCGAELVQRGVLVGEPVCHQVSEIVTRVEVTEHRRLRVRCDCGRCTLAGLPAGVPAGAFGPGVAAAAATLTAARVGRRETVRIFSDLFGLTVSTASLQSLLEQTAITLEDPYLEILRALDTEPVRGADETSWPQAGQGQWLSVSHSERMALFQIAKHRDRDAAKALLGENPAGVIVTDRYAVYLYVDDTRRQMCLAHLARDLIALGERDGQPGKLGRALTRELGRVFHILHAPERDPTDLPALRADIAPVRQAFHDLLAKGARGRDLRTRRFCQGLLDHETALWTFTRVPGVPATNNASERALRHAVHWRRTSYGTQTDTGNQIVERLLTARETCRLQARRLHDYLTAAITAALHGQPIPAILTAPSPP
jgi:transposase